jgi:hypothetical protein
MADPFGFMAGFFQTGNKNNEFSMSILWIKKCISR